MSRKFIDGKTPRTVAFDDEETAVDPHRAGRPARDADPEGGRKSGRERGRGRPDSRAPRVEERPTVLGDGREAGQGPPPRAPGRAGRRPPRIAESRDPTPDLGLESTMPRDRRGRGDGELTPTLQPTADPAAELTPELTREPSVDPTVDYDRRGRPRRRSESEPLPPDDPTIEAPLRTHHEAERSRWLTSPGTRPPPEHQSRRRGQGDDERTRVAGGDARTRVASGDQRTRVAGGDQRTRVASGDQRTRVAGGDARTRVAGGDQRTRVASGDQRTRVAGGDARTRVAQSARERATSPGKRPLPVRYDDYEDSLDESLDSVTVAETAGDPGDNLLIQFEDESVRARDDDTVDPVPEPAARPRGRQKSSAVAKPTVVGKRRARTEAPTAVGRPQRRTDRPEGRTDRPEGRTDRPEGRADRPEGPKPQSLGVPAGRRGRKRVPTEDEVTTPRGPGNRKRKRD